MSMDFWYLLLFAGSGAGLGVFLSSAITLVNVMDEGRSKLAGAPKRIALTAAGGVAVGLFIFFLLVYADIIL